MWRIGIYCVFILAGFGLTGCHPTIDAFADPKEIYVVYGVLNPNAQSQIIKVEQVWQVNGDAEVFAAENDVTVSGLTIRLAGDGKIWEAVETADIPRDSGVFQANQRIYQFITKGDSALKPGQRYTLTIDRSDVPDFETITSETQIPYPPRLTFPGNFVYNIHTYLYNYPSVDFTDEIIVYFRPSDALGYELRVWFNYLENGHTKLGKWGPTPLFFNSKGCGRSTGQGELCYKIPGGSVPHALRKTINQAAGTIDYVDEPQLSGSLQDLSKSCWLEVTAVDSFLSRYLYSNQPYGYGLNLLMDKPELSNISPPHIGIFGSFSTDLNYINLSACTKYQGGLLSVPPSFCN